MPQGRFFKFFPWRSALEVSPKTPGVTLPLHSAMGRGPVCLDGIREVGAGKQASRESELELHQYWAGGRPSLQASTCKRYARNRAPSGIFVVLAGRRDVVRSQGGLELAAAPWLVGELCSKILWVRETRPAILDGRLLNAPHTQLQLPYKGCPELHG